MVAWVKWSDTAFTGPVAAVPAGSVLQDGWTENVEPVWSIDAGGVLRSANTTAGYPWTDGVLSRPYYETGDNIRVVATIDASPATTFWFVLRAQHPQSNKWVGYLLGVNSPDGQTLELSWNTLTGGALGSRQDTAFTAAPTGSQIVLDMSVTQTDANTTAISIVATNPDGTAIGTATGTDTTEYLQNKPGVAGVFMFPTGNGAAGGIVSMQTFSDHAKSIPYSITGPKTLTQGVASTYTFAAVASVDAGATVTPAASIAGTWSPATVTIPAGAPSPVTATFTPSAAGLVSITGTNSGSMTDPAALTGHVWPANAIAPSNAGFRYSPFNWSGNAGRLGDVWRSTWNSGAWVEFSFTASASPTLTLFVSSENSGATVVVSVNGVHQQPGGIGSAGINVSGLVASTVNVVRVTLVSMPQETRWAYGASSLRVAGAMLDSGSTVKAATAASATALLIGDSITEGIEAADGISSVMCDYSYFVGLALELAGTDLGISACGYSGLLAPGDFAGDVPPYYHLLDGTYDDTKSRWNKVDAGVSILDANGHFSAYGGTGQEPSIIALSYMTNDAISGYSPDACQAVFSAILTAWRAAAPEAWLFLIVPFSFHDVTHWPVAYMQALHAAVAAYKAANPADTKVAAIDLGAGTSALLKSGPPFLNGDNLHPQLNGHAACAPMVLDQMRLAMLQAPAAPAGGSPGVSLFPVYSFG